MGDRSRKRWLRAARSAVVAAMILTTAVQGRAAPAPAEVPATRPEDRVIFDAKATRKWMPAMAESELWTPALADVLALEQNLPGYLREHRDAHENPGKGPLWKRAPAYKRQYFGISRRGARVIYANFFCRLFEPGQDWHHMPVQVEDGGDCYFSIKYDVKRGAFYDFMVNGEA
jgi:hypothetical protein